MGGKEGHPCCNVPEMPRLLVCESELTGVKRVWVRAVVVHVHIGGVLFRATHFHGQVLRCATTFINEPKWLRRSLFGNQCPRPAIPPSKASSKEVERRLFIKFLGEFGQPRVGRNKNV